MHTSRFITILRQHSTLALIGCLLLSTGSVHAQTDSIPASSVSVLPTYKPFQHLDLGITLGVSGIGLELQAPISGMVRLRAGFAAMPHFEVGMDFGVQVGDDPSTSHSKFERLSGLLTQFTSYQVKESVHMVGNPTYWNAKLLVDVYPFHNKHWHFTGGLYLGNRVFAEAVNSAEDMSTLLGVGIYNNSIYHMCDNNVNHPECDMIPLLEWNGTSVFLTPAMEERIVQYGRMGMYVGDYARDIYEDGTLAHKAGDPYIMEPGADGMVRAQVLVNRVKPYVGVGYEGALSRREPRLKVGFDAGVMFWGGTPSVVTHDGTDLVNDLIHVRGKVGRVLDAITAFKLCPMAEVHLSYQLF